MEELVPVERKAIADSVNWARIGEGRYRVVYRVSDDVVIKVMKQERAKSYWLFTVHYPMAWYTKRKFGIRDFNDEEYKNYCAISDKIPPNMRGNFAMVYGVVETCNGTRGSLAELVKDHNGKVSQPLSASSGIDDGAFWKRLSELENLLLGEDILLADIRGENIVVKRQKDGTAVPVFVDYKRLGGRTYPFQLLMRFPSQIKRKMKRRFERLRMKYRR